MDISVNSSQVRFLVSVSDDMMGTGAASAAKKIVRVAVRYPAGRLPEIPPAAGQSMKVFQAIREAQAAERVDITV